MKKLALVEWTIGQVPLDNKGNMIRLAGRDSGLGSWVLTLAKIEPIHHLRISAERVEFRSTSLSGVQSRIIPLERVSSTYYQFHRPWKEAVALFIWIGLFVSVPAGLSSIANVLGFLIGGVFAFGGAVLYYWLNKAIVVGVVEFSGLVSALAFKRSVIEGIELNSDMGKDFATNAEWHLANTLRQYNTVP
jgi:hypothetical protein